MERRPYQADAQERVPPIRSQQVATLPWFRAGGGSVFAAQSRHEEPYLPMSKINPTFPLHPSSHGECRKVYPIHSPVSSGKCGFWKLREGVQGLTGDLRQETRDMRRQSDNETGNGVRQ